MKIFILTASLLIASCQQNSTKTDTVDIGAYKFELIQKGNEAILRTISNNKKSDVRLSLKPPCYFLREEGELQTFAYDDIGVESVAIVIGNIVDKVRKSEYGVESDKICGEKIQGFVIKHNNVFITEKTISGALSCKDNGLDEKDFWDFAHEENLKK